MTGRRRKGDSRKRSLLWLQPGLGLTSFFCDFPAFPKYSLAMVLYTVLPWKFLPSKKLTKNRGLRKVSPQAEQSSSSKGHPKEPRHGGSNAPHLPIPPSPLLPTPYASQSPSCAHASCLVLQTPLLCPRAVRRVWQGRAGVRKGARGARPPETCTCLIRELALC